MQINLGGQVWKVNHLQPDVILARHSEADIELAMKSAWLAFGSDGVAVNPTMSFMRRPHPRFYGTFSRVLGLYVRERHVLTLPDAIRKMTSLAPQITGLTDRGILRPGIAADITIFDPNTIADKATFEDPEHYPLGIAYVIVNGVVVVDKGEHTGAKPGRVLMGRGRHGRIGVAGEHGGVGLHAPSQNVTSTAPFCSIARVSCRRDEVDDRSERGENER